MTIPKKGRRLVTVGDSEYAWRIRKKPTYSQATAQGSMTLAIQANVADARSVLLVDVKISRPDNWITSHQTAVKPAMVREMITEALATGWQPLSSTGTFQLEYPLILDRP
jgi:hypothetical protein